MDYCFFSKGAMEEVEEEHAGGSVPVLVAYDEAKNGLWALQTQKGGSAEATKWSCDTLEDSGYAGMGTTIKSDQEPAIIKLKQMITESRTAETTPPANGRMENAVKVFQGQLRVLKSYFEGKVKRQLPPDCALLLCLIPWTAEVVNKFRVWPDGKTCYEKITGRACKHEVFEFGESVLWQITPDKSDGDKYNGEFRDGIFLGVVWRSSEYIIGTREGVLRCRTVKPRPEETAYDPECIEYITASYSSYMLEGARTKGAKLRFAKDVPTVRDEEVRVRAGNEWRPRRIYLKPADFVRHGCTPGCLGCQFLQTNLGATRGHNEVCRNFIYA